MGKGYTETHDNGDGGREVVQWEAEARERIGAWVARRAHPEIRSVFCLILGGVLGACYIAEVTNPQWQAPSPPALKPYAWMLG
jgi:hypothetical protein